MGLFQSKPQTQTQSEGEVQPKSEVEDKVSKIIDELEEATTTKTIDKSVDTLIPEPTYTEEIKSTDEKSTITYTYIEEFEPAEDTIHIEDAKEERASEESRTAEEALATDDTKKKKKSKRNKKQQKQANDVEIFDLVA